MNHIKHFKLVKDLVRHQLVQPSKEDGCHTVLDVFGEDRFSVPIIGKGGN